MSVINHTVIVYSRNLQGRRMTLGYRHRLRRIHKDSQSKKLWPQNPKTSESDDQTCTRPENNHESLREKIIKDQIRQSAAWLHIPPPGKNYRERNISFQLEKKHGPVTCNSMFLGHSRSISTFTCRSI